MGSHSHAQTAAGNPGSPAPLILEVLQGRTQFRHRPVTTHRFLIGSGPACDLRLGGADIPAVHSLILITSEGITLEALSASPPLLHNGEEVQSVQLQEGDIFQIGALQFRAHVTGELPAAIPAPVGTVPVTAADESDDAVPVADLSASELLDLIEREDAAVEDAEQRRLQGAQALLQTLQARTNKRPARDRRDPAISSVPAPHFHVGIPAVGATIPVAAAVPAQLAAEPALDSASLIQELEGIGQTLHLLSQDIQSRSQRSTERELTLAQTISQVLDAQQRLVAQLEQVTRQVQALQARELSPRPKPRAIA